MCRSISRHQSSRELGAGLVEYAVLVALISVAGIASIRYFGASAYCTNAFSEWRIRWVEWYSWDPGFFENKDRYMSNCIRERLRDQSIEDINHAYEAEYGFSAD